MLSTEKRASAGVAPASGGAGTVGVDKAVEPTKRSGEATASLILGLFSFVPIVGLLAVIFGHLAKASIRRSRGGLLGSGMAFFGLLFGYYGLGCGVIYAILSNLESPLMGRLFPLLAGAGLLGIIFGYRARIATALIEGRFLGKGKATLRIVLGCVAVAGWLVYLIAPYAIPVFEQKTNKLNELTAKLNEQTGNCSSVEDCAKKIAEINRLMAEIEKNRPHNELAWQHALTVVYIGLGAICLMLIVLVMVRRIRQRKA
jgi:hypothetical protein